MDIATSLKFSSEAERSSRYVFADNTLVHYDLRADNCPWNAGSGQVKIVDWTWAQLGDQDIDLAATLTHIQKSGFDAAAEGFDSRRRDAFHWLAGFWFTEVVTPIWDGGPAHLRKSQLISGVTAMRLARPT